MSDKDYKIYRDISIFAILNICFLVCVFSPFALYSSDVTQFDATQTTSTLCALAGFFILTSGAIIYTTSFFYKTRLLKIGTFAFCVVLSIGFIYCFVLDFNVMTGESYSEIDNFTFKNPHNLSAPQGKFVDLAIGILSCVVAMVLLRFRQITLVIFRVFFISFVAVGGIYCYKIIKDTHNLDSAKIAESNSKNPADSAKLPAYHGQLTAFSKDDLNVLILLFDGFSGSHLKYIFEQFPEFEREFSGFTYYPNTLSVDGHTTRTAHTILSGHALAPYANKEKSLEQYAKSAKNALIESYRQFAKAGFEVSSFGMPYLQNADSAPKIHIYEYGDDYFESYKNAYNLDDLVQNLRAKNRPIGEMISMGLFYFAPYSFRVRIYRDFEFGNYSWIFGSKVQIGGFINGLKNTSQLPMIADNLNTNATQKTLKYIHTMHTHYPFSLDSADCAPKFNAPSQLPAQFRAFVANPNHYDNEICAIKETIKILHFLKAEKIYDNTMIALVSDHSYNDIIEHNMPKKSLGNNPNPLLMIKHFNANGALKTDMRLMSNADVYGILCDKLNACDEKNILQNYPKNRKIIHTLNIHWTQKAQRNDGLIFEKVWEVEDVLDTSKWKEIK
ncbi:sulfatase-like hydrolase/transferase [Helicobacter sp. 23-1044]